MRNRFTISLLMLLQTFIETDICRFFHWNEFAFFRRLLTVGTADCLEYRKVRLNNNYSNCASVLARFNSTTKPLWWR